MRKNAPEMLENTRFCRPQACRSPRQHTTNFAGMMQHLDCIFSPKIGVFLAKFGYLFQDFANEICDPKLRLLFSVQR
jgi:hypothetical protein